MTADERKDVRAAQREIDARILDAAATRAMEDGNTALVAILRDLAEQIRGRRNA